MSSIETTIPFLIITLTYLRPDSISPVLYIAPIYDDSSIVSRPLLFNGVIILWDSVTACSVLGCFRYWIFPSAIEDIK